MNVPVRALDNSNDPDTSAEFSVLNDDGHSRAYDSDGLPGPSGEFELPVPPSDYREI